MEEALVDAEDILISHNKTSEVADPGEGTFYVPTGSIGKIVHFVGPASLPELADATLWLDRAFHALLSQVVPEAPGIISFVCDKLLGPLAHSAGLGPNCDLVKNYRRKIELRYLRTGKMARDGDSSSVGNEHPFGAFAFPGKPYRISPFLAGAKLPSMNACAQASLSCASRLESTHCHILCHTPCSSQALSRRQQVTYEPYFSGIAAHGAPVRSTQRIPSRVRLSSARGRPIMLCLGR